MNKKIFYLLICTLATPIMSMDSSYSTKNQLLIQYVHREESESVRNILEQGADSNTIDYSTNPPKSVLHIAIDNVNWHSIKKLLEHGAHPNAINEHKETALHRACMKGTPRIVKLLLDHGANPSALDHNNNTALHCYCQHAGLFKTPHVEIIRILTEKGLDINQVNTKLESPLRIACAKNNQFLVEALTEHGARATKTCLTISSDPAIQLLCKQHLSPAIQQECNLKNALKLTVCFAALLYASTCNIL